jgi:DNA-binding PadR family transcriptional regulator
MRNWKLVSFVKRGRIRFEVLKQLSSNPATPTEISKAIKRHRPSVSRALADLESKGLVECLTPNEKLGRIYSITPKGTSAIGF